MTLDEVPVGTINVELGPDARAYRRKDDTRNPDFKGGRLSESDIDSLIDKHGGA
ncbi:MAG: type IV secretion protein Rhs [Burkholderiales bacterium]|nr:type IV secretion protein Rhs [Burkholderiales bacterium]